MLFDKRVNIYNIKFTRNTKKENILTIYLLWIVFNVCLRFYKNVKKCDFLSFLLNHFKLDCQLD